MVGQGWDRIVTLSEPQTGGGGKETGSFSLSRSPLGPQTQGCYSKSVQETTAWTDLTIRWLFPLPPVRHQLAPYCLLPPEAGLTGFEILVILPTVKFVSGWLPAPAGSTSVTAHIGVSVFLSGPSRFYPATWEHTFIRTLIPTGASLDPGLEMWCSAMEAIPSTAV